MTLMLRKKEKDLETEYKQLQLESQGKEGRLIALVNEVEVKKKNTTLSHEWVPYECTCRVCEFSHLARC